MGKRKGLFQHYHGDHPSPLNEFLRDLTRPGYVKGKPKASLPSKPRSEAEFRGNQRAFGIVLLAGGLIMLPLGVGARIGFDVSRLNQINGSSVGTAIALLTAAGVILLYVSRKR